MVTITEYTPELTNISKSVLLELVTTLKSYSTAFVLVGGWAPYFILERFKEPENKFEHIGSIDIDLAINPAMIDARKYASIVELITKRGYTPRLDRVGNITPFSFERTITVNKEEYAISVDFLSTEYNMLIEKKHRHRRIQPDLLARTMHGCEIVLDHYFEHEITGILPGDGEIAIKLKVADVVGVITTKGIVLGERYNEKDAYDIYVVIANYKNGPRSVAEEVRPYLDNKLVKEAIENIEERFTDIKSPGPSWVANFFSGDEETRRRRTTDAFMNVSEFLRLIR